MRSYNLGMMDRGFFVGDFVPAAFNSKDVELSIKGMTKGTFDGGYYRKKDSELICVLKGKIESNGTTYNEGDIIVFDTDEKIGLFALTDTQILIAKFPGTKGDVHKWDWSSYAEFDNYYYRYVKNLMEMENVNYDFQYVNSSISNKDITVVIQGYVSEKTKFLIDSIKKYLNGAHVIISTWNYCETKGLECDEIILNEDPGAFPCEIWDGLKKPNNGNRQIVSTQNGIDRVKTKYTLKVRSDLVLFGDTFIKYFLLNYNRDDRYVFFDKKIVIGELYSRHDFVYHRNGKKYIVPKPFHPSDWFAFGLTSDLKKLYMPAKLIPNDELQYNQLVHQDYVEKYEYKYAWRYTTEQHIFLSGLREKFNDIEFRDWTDWSETTIKLSDKLMHNNFIFLDLARSNILNMNYITACFANNDYCHPEERLYTFKETESTIEREMNDT